MRLPVPRVEATHHEAALSLPAVDQLPETTSLWQHNPGFPELAVSLQVAIGIHQPLSPQSVVCSIQSLIR